MLQLSHTLGQTLNASTPKTPVPASKAMSVKMLGPSAADTPPAALVTCGTSGRHRAHMHALCPMTPVTRGLPLSRVSAHLHMAGWQA
jgi:hypothetical protein